MECGIITRLCGFRMRRGQGPGYGAYLLGPNQTHIGIVRRNCAYLRMNIILGNSRVKVTEFTVLLSLVWDCLLLLLCVSIVGIIRSNGIFLPSISSMGGQTRRVLPLENITLFVVSQIMSELPKLFMYQCILT